MRLYSCIQHFEEDTYRLSKLNGALLRFAGTKAPPHRMPAKVQRFIDLCNDPYLLRHDNAYESCEPIRMDDTPARRILRRTLWLATRNFLAARLYAAMSQPLFPNSSAAIRWFHANTPPNLHSRLCLPRSLFAAKTSAAFQHHGAVIIGSLLPTRNMHAWVIEHNAQPDDQDRIWICYRPVAVLA